MCCSYSCMDCLLSFYARPYVLCNFYSCNGVRISHWIKGYLTWLDLFYAHWNKTPWQADIVTLWFKTGLYHLNQQAICNDIHVISSHNKSFKISWLSSDCCRLPFSHICTPAPVITKLFNVKHKPWFILLRLYWLSGLLHDTENLSKRIHFVVHLSFSLASCNVYISVRPSVRNADVFWLGSVISKVITLSISLQSLLFGALTSAIYCNTQVSGEYRRAVGKWLF